MDDNMLNGLAKRVGRFFKMFLKRAEQSGSTEPVTAIAVNESFIAKINGKLVRFIKCNVDEDAYVSVDAKTGNAVVRFYVPCL